MEARFPPHRELVVPEAGAGMRLDRLLSRWFKDRSRSELARCIRAGEVTDGDGQPLRASASVRAGQVLRVFIAGIAPATPPPPFPDVLLDDRGVIVVDKPAGLPVHPAGSTWQWSVIGLAKTRWPDDDVDLVHRLDRDTSGCLVLTTRRDAKVFLAARLHDPGTVKQYLALVDGHVPWDRRVLDGAIGREEADIRIRMAIRPDGQPAHTDARVLARSTTGPPRSLVACRITTGRTHQIRLHLFDQGHRLVGDRLYGVPDDSFLRTVHDELAPEELTELVGAPRHLLHAHHIELPHPDGGRIVVTAPLPSDLAAALAAMGADPATIPNS